MSRLCSRHLAAALCWLMLAPAAALADGTSTSAGDQQYVDPLAGATTPAASAKPRPSSTTGASATPGASSSPAASPAPPATGPPPAASGASDVVSSPSAGTTSSGARAGGGTLPFTGFDTPGAVAAGVVLLAAGAGLRRRLRAS